MQEIIDRYRIKAKKSLWQNFLMDENTLQKMIEITPIEWKNIVEIGPGFWVLTKKIIDVRPSTLTLVELDDFMIEILNDRIKRKELEIEKTEFTLLHQDVLKFEPKYEKYSVVANIPYYITSPILQKFLYEAEKKPENMIILMQKEVGERICDKKSSVLSLIVQKKCTTSPKIIVPRHFFSPAPKVDSIVLFFETHNLYNEVEDSVFLKFIKASFSNPRKKLVSNLWGVWYDKNTLLDTLIWLWFWENTRAEELWVKDYIFLIQKLSSIDKKS